MRRQAELTKPPGSLGRLEEIAEWLAAWQGRARPRRRAAAHRGVRRHPRRGGARRLGLSAGSHPADGDRTSSTAGPRSTSSPRRRRRPAHLRARPRPSDRRLHRGPAMSEARSAQRHGLRHDGGRARHRRAVPGRDGHRQHHRRRRRCALAPVRRQRGATGPAPAPASTAPRSTTKIARSSTRRWRATRRRRRRDPLDLLAAARRRGTRRHRRRHAGRAHGPHPGAARRLCLHRRGRGAVRRRPRALDHCLVAHRSAEPGHARLLERDRPAAAARPRTCGWARPRARRSPCRSSRRPPPATTAWRPSPKRGSAGRLNPGLTAPASEFRSITDRSGRCEYCA